MTNILSHHISHLRMKFQIQKKHIVMMMYTCMKTLAYSDDDVHLHDVHGAGTRDHTVMMKTLA